MKNLINREDYIKEYLRVNINVENSNELYESLLSTVFGGLNMLFKRDWANIKCKNSTVLKYLQEIDKTLTGYTMVKMEFSSECKTIRQNIADYFNDILDYKLKQLEKEEDPNKLLNSLNDENKDAKGVAKKLNLADKILLDTLDKYKSNIKIACKQSPKLREYADQMLNCVEIFINSVILDELEKKGADKEKVNDEKKKLEEQSKQQEKERQENNKKTKEESENAVQNLNRSRNNALKKLGVTPMTNVSSDVAIKDITKQFSEIVNAFKDYKLLKESKMPEVYADIFKNDTYIGIQQSLERLDWKLSEIVDKKYTDDAVYEKFIMCVILNKINTVFSKFTDQKVIDKFKDIPCTSIQAMFVALSNAVIYGFMGDKFKIDNKNNAAVLSLLTKCAIDSDATIGFSLPLFDDENPDNGNMFTFIMHQFKNTELKTEEVKNALGSLTKKEKELLFKKVNGEKDETIDEKEQNETIESIGSDMMTQFKSNMTNLFEVIIKKAETLKKKAQEKRDAEAAKAQQESESNENE